MYKILSQSGKTSYGIKEFVVDTYEDIKTLPECDMGSAVLVLSESNVYMKNSEGSWVML